MQPEAAGLRFTTRVTDGGLGLGITMSWIPKMGSPESLAKLLIEELKQRNVVYGLDEPAIRQLMADRILGSEVIIARGTPVRRGRDAEIELLLTPPSFMPTAGEDGRVDYRNVDNVAQVKAGDVISRKVPADPGEPGFNVFGKEIRPPAVREAHHPAGRNTTVSADGLETRAAIDGFLRWQGSVIDVVELYLLMGDVDLHSGNIHYQGDIEVHGNVLRGFEIVAGGDVRIVGSVDGGRVSSEGSVVVTGGVLGTSEGPALVTAGGNIQVGRLRSARVESRTGSITVNRAAENSEVHAAGDLVLLAGPAVNCVVKVGGRVDVASLGAQPKAEAAPALVWNASNNRRRYLRVPLTPPVEAQVIRENAGQNTQATLLDLSAGGVRLRLSQRLSEGEAFQLQFRLPNVEGTMWMEAQVVRRCALPEDAYGLQFSRIEAAVREAIARFCLAEDLRQHKLTGKAG